MVRLLADRFCRMYRRQSGRGRERERDEQLRRSAVANGHANRCGQSGSGPRRLSQTLVRVTTHVGRETRGSVAPRTRLGRTSRCSESARRRCNLPRRRSGARRSLNSAFGPLHLCWAVVIWRTPKKEW